MIITITNTIEGKKITEYMGVVTGRAIVKINAFRQYFDENVDDVPQSYIDSLNDVDAKAMEDIINQAKDLKADAVVGVEIKYQPVGKVLLFVVVTGTAVKLQ